MKQRTQSAAVVLAAASLWSMAVPASESAHAVHTLQIVDRIPGPDAGQWDYASFDPVHRRLYVTRTEGVMAIDVDTKKVTAKLLAGKEGRATVVLPGSKELVSTFATDSLAVIYDALTGAVFGKLVVTGRPDAALYDANSRNVLVMSKQGDVSVIDPANRKLVKSFNVGGSLEFAAVDENGRLYVNDSKTNQIVVVDVAKGAVVTRYALAGCDGPTGLTYVAEEALLVSVCENGVAKAIVAATGKDLATISVGKGADAVFYDAKHGQLFVPAGDDGDLAVIRLIGKGQAPMLMERIPTQLNARTGALDPTTGTVYLPVGELVPNSEWEVPPVLGTFKVLVLKRN